PTITYATSCRSTSSPYRPLGCTCCLCSCLSHERRRVIHFNVTEHPTAAWTAQQIVEAFPEDQAPRYLIRDRDGVYGEYFQHRVQGMPSIADFFYLYAVSGYQASQLKLSVAGSQFWCKHPSEIELL